jgi:hypothetical protein
MDYLTQKRTRRGSVHLPDSGRLFMSTAIAKLDGELLPLTSRLSQRESVFGKTGSGRFRRMTGIGTMFAFGVDLSWELSGMSYKMDHRSRTRAVAVYGVLICVGAALGFIVRAGVITDHILW